MARVAWASTEVGAASRSASAFAIAGSSDFGAYASATVARGAAGSASTASAAGAGGAAPPGPCTLRGLKSLEEVT